MFYALYMFINLLIALLLMFFAIKEEDTCWFNIILYLVLCVVLTPLIGIPIYKIHG